MNETMTLTFNLKMFSPKNKLVVVKSKGYESIISHRHEFVEIGYIISGKAKHFVGDKELKIQENDMFVIADDTSHNIRPICPESSFEILNIIFDKSLFDIDYTSFKARNIYTFDKLSPIGKLIEKITLEYFNKKQYYEQMCNYLVGELIYSILRERAVVRSRLIMPSKDKSINSYIDSAVKYVQYNYKESITVNEVAKTIGLSKGYLQKIFKEQRNTGIIEYLITYRMEQSCKLLIETDYPVSKIAEEVGINDLKHFYTIFKRYFALTPSEYRKNNREEKKCLQLVKK